MRKVASKSVLNSGANAISFAAACGAKRIVLLGYDAQHTGGAKHWHGDHPKNLKNAGTVEKWPAKFSEVAAQLPADLSVINCSRATALTCFPRGELETALQ